MSIRPTALGSIALAASAVSHHLYTLSPVRIRPDVRVSIVRQFMLPPRRVRKAKRRNSVLTFTLEQDRQPAIAEPTTLVGDLAHQFAHSIILSAKRLVLPRRPVDPDQPAGATLRDPAKAGKGAGRVRRHPQPAGTVAARCLIPGFDGALSTVEWKDALWARYSTGAPHDCVETAEAERDGHADGVANRANRGRIRHHAARLVTSSRIRGVV
jgi:hypothetical protein